MIYIEKLLKERYSSTRFSLSLPFPAAKKNIFSSLPHVMLVPLGWQVKSNKNDKPVRKSQSRPATTLPPFPPLPLPSPHIPPTVIYYSPSLSAFRWGFFLSGHTLRHFEDRPFFYPSRLVAQRNIK
jgi:hypothetical protein